MLTTSKITRSQRANRRSAKRSEGDEQKHAAMSGFWKWVAENPIKTATSLGAVSYAALWVGYYLFYSNFGVDVQEVGLGYAEILTQAVAYFVAMVVILFVDIWLLIILFFLFLWALYAIASLVTTLVDMLFEGQLNAKLESLFKSRVARRETSAAAHKGSLAFTTVTALSIVLTVALIFVIGVLDAKQSVEAIQSGKSVRAHVVWRVIPSPYRFRGELVEVKWVGRDAPMDFDGCFVYLGTANSTNVLYDYRKKKTLRLPSGSVLIIAAQGGQPQICS